MFDAPRLARLYGLVLGAGLLLEGGVLLLLDLVRTPTGDTRHNALHVVWGLTILLVLWPKNEPYRTTLVMLVFGAFYSLLAVAGVVIDKPFGLLLGPGENAFHFIVGPLALGLGILSLIQLQRSSSSASSAEADADPSSAVAGSGELPR